MTNSVLKIENFTYTYPGTGDPVLKNIFMDVFPGECHCITGPTGSGKSTLLLAAKNLLPNGTQSGDIITPTASLSKSRDKGTDIEPNIKSSLRPDIGIVLQNPETQLLGTTIGAEVAFVLENACVSPFEMEKKIRQALLAVGLKKPLNFPVSRLSMGEKYRLIVAAVIVMAPAVLLLDEPAAQLDNDGIIKLKSILFSLKKKGVAVIFCEHHPQYFFEIIDHYRQIDTKGHLNKIPTPKVSVPISFILPKKKLGIKGPEKIIEAKNLSPSTGRNQPIWDSATFDLDPGQRLGIFGKNGTGKTTLLRCLCGFIPPLTGEIKLFGKPPSPKKLQGKLGCLFQNPQKQLFENTVFDEIAFPLKRLGTGTKAIKKKVDEIIDKMDISHLSRFSPHKLSFGQKHLVVLASILIFRPRLLILDDPFAGLDKDWRKKVGERLSFICENHKTTLIWTSHRKDDFFTAADMVLEVKGGKIALST